MENTSPDPNERVIAKARSLASLGSEIRQLRKAREMGLKDLAVLAGISISHLSAIERNASNPSIEVLQSIGDALGVSADWFFSRRSGAGPLERAHVVRAENRRDLNRLYQQSSMELGYEDRLLSSSIGGQFYMGLATYFPGAEGPNEPLLQHDGEEHGVVIEGELEMQIGDELIRLRAGDSYSFSGSIPHHGRNRSDRICKLVWAVSPVVIPKDVLMEEAQESVVPDGTAAL
ncbi:MAG: cupin domain-containing protein [Pseudomonadota bacterium]